MKQKVIATAALIALIAFLVQVARILHGLHDWEPINPNVAGDIVMAVVTGLIAFAAGIGINVRELLSGLGFGDSNTFSQQKVAELNRKDTGV